MKKETPRRALLTPDEVAEMLRVARKTVIVMARDGRIPSLRVGRFVRFDAAEVERWLSDQRRYSRRRHPGGSAETPPHAM